MYDSRNVYEVLIGCDVSVLIWKFEENKICRGCMEV